MKPSSLHVAAIMAAWPSWRGKEKMAVSLPEDNWRVVVSAQRNVAEIAIYGPLAWRVLRIPPGAWKAKRLHDDVMLITTRMLKALHLFGPT